MVILNKHKTVSHIFFYVFNGLNTFGWDLVEVIWGLNKLMQ